MKILMIRHGMTPGNKLHRYIGSTDEGLSLEGQEQLIEKKNLLTGFGLPIKLFVSPMKRCIETAEIFYPGMNKKVIEKLREFDFGIFENKNYQELSGNKQYQEWLDQMCETQVPDGENMADFKKRCCEGLKDVLNICHECIKKELLHTSDMIALVVHGGTIMSLMECYADEKKGYYDWSVKNGEGYLVETDTENFINGKKVLHVLKKI